MLTIASRSDIGLRAPTKTSAISSYKNGWYVHWVGAPVSATTRTAEMALLRGIQNYHIATKGWRDIAYSFAIGQSGTVYELRGWETAGGHTSGTNPLTGLNNNFNGLGVCFLIGPGQLPSQAALDSMAELVDTGLAHGVPKIIKPHSFVSSTGTQCPGPDLTTITNSAYFTHTRQEPIAMKTIVTQLYNDILGRGPDDEGLAYWTEVLEDGRMSKEDLQWEFVRVRLAADAVAFKALSAKVSAPSAGGPTAEQVAEQAYRMFLDGLRSLGYPDLEETTSVG